MSPLVVVAKIVASVFVLDSALQGLRKLREITRAGWPEDDVLLVGGVLATVVFLLVAAFGVWAQ